MDNYHISKNQQRWELVKEGAQRASKTAATKAEITQIASDYLQDKTASLKIHRGRDDPGRTHLSARSRPAKNQRLSRLFFSVFIVSSEGSDLWSLHVWDGAH